MDYRGRCRFDFDEGIVAVHDFVQVIQMVVYGKILHVPFEASARIVGGPLRLVIIVLTQIETFLSLAYPIIDKCILQALAAKSVKISRFLGALDILRPGFA